MSKNRQQLKTGLRAILGGNLREETAAPEPVETAEPEVEPESAKAQDVTVDPVIIVKQSVAEEKNAPDDDVMEEVRVVVVSDEPTRKSRKKPLAPPPPEPKVKMAPAVRVGTLDNPYVRKRDNLPTRKVGIVLPVALAERMQIHCVKARTRPNEFVARAIEALLDELQA